MRTIHLKPTDAAVSQLSRAFPSYNGKTFKLTVHDAGGMSLASYWDGGSRDYFAIVRLADMQTIPVPQNGSGFDGYGYGIEVPLPAPGYAVVEHSIFCGSDTGLTFHIHAENAAPLLPAPTAELSWAQRVVLVATRNLKSSHNGRTRFDVAENETGITRAEWDTAKAELIASRHLNAAGVLTIDGKNAAGTGNLYRLGKERKAEVM